MLGIFSYCVSGMDSKCVHEGRPFVGCCILWHKSLDLKVTPIPSNNNRIGAVSVKSNNVHILLCSVYMPCDNPAFAAQYRDTLLEIYSVLASATNDEIVIGGDFNRDFSRTNSHNTQMLNEFIENEELLQCDTLQYADIPYTFASK